MQQVFLENASSFMTLDELPQAYARSGNRVTRTSDLFWSKCNMTPLLRQIEAEVSRQSNMKVSVAVDQGLYLRGERLIRSYPDTLDVRNINQRFYEETVKDHVSDILRRKHFYKMYIYQDRPRTIEPPRLTHGRRCFQPLSTEAYSLGDPDNLYYDQYMKYRKSSVKRPSLFNVFY